MKDPQTAAFVKAFQKKYPGSRPGIFSSQGYDNLMVIADAIKRAGKLRPATWPRTAMKVRDALTKTTDLKLSQGTIKFGPDGQVYTVLALGGAGAAEQGLQARHLHHLSALPRPRPNTRTQALVQAAVQVIPRHRSPEPAAPRNTQGAGPSAPPPTPSQGSGLRPS